MARKNVSPLGKLKFPRLNTPDIKYNNYNTKLLLDMSKPEDVQFIEDITAFMNAEIDRQLQDLPPKKLKDIGEPIFPFGPDTNKEGEETGLMSVKFTTKHPPRVVNASREDIKDIIFSGAEAYIAYGPKVGLREKENAFGLTLYLNAVQVMVNGCVGGSVDDFEDFSAPTEAGADGNDVGSNDVPF